MNAITFTNDRLSELSYYLLCLRVLAHPEKYVIKGHVLTSGAVGEDATAFMKYIGARKKFSGIIVKRWRQMCIYSHS